MKRRLSGLSLVAATALLVAQAGSAAAAPKEPPVGIVVIYLGGPDTGAEGKKLIDQLIEHLAGAMALDPASLVGAYFNETKPAIEHLKKNKDAFILGSLGFYLANRKAMALSPLALLKSAANGEERDYVMVRKGRYKSLDELKGKALYGSPLFEEQGYLDRVVFGGKLDVAKHFDLKPTSRPLSAVRKLEKDEADAVLLNTVQYDSLRRMPLFEKLEVVYTSELRPALGLMMTETPRTKALRDKMLKAVVDVCATPKGQSLCSNFGIAGFEPVKPGALDATIKVYEPTP
jgi:ABC-type amino acid transport substrate-binding protein